MPHLTVVEQRDQIVAAAEKKSAEIATEITNIEKEIDIEIGKTKTDIKRIEELMQGIEKLEEQAKISRPEIVVKANEILRCGDPIRYIIDSCSRRVKGAENAIQKMVCSTSVQNIWQSMGLHPKFNGGSGDGKTLMLIAYACHLPQDAVVLGSASNLSGFYHDDGDRVLRICDDYKSGNEAFDTIIKQTSSLFHKRYKHRTVKNQEPVTLEIGSEQTWAITSVDSSQDIQVLNRQLPINVDGSVETTTEVNAATIERYGKGDVQYPEDEPVLVCRSMWQILRDEGMINIRVPFYQRIKWHDNTNRRNPSLFMDLVIAHTAMYRYQREQDADGYYLASESDFDAARNLFVDQKDAQELVLRLTAKEREAASIISENPLGLTRDEIGDKMNPPVCPQRVGQILNGEGGKGGLMQKLPIKKVKVAETVRLDDTHSKTQYRTIYTLLSFESLGIDSIVTLEPERVEKG